jgi:hypothetical protein
MEVEIKKIVVGGQQDPISANKPGVAMYPMILAMWEA